MDRSRPTDSDAFPAPLAGPSNTTLGRRIGFAGSLTPSLALESPHSGWGDQKGHLDSPSGARKAECGPFHDAQELQGEQTPCGRSGQHSYVPGYPPAFGGHRRITSIGLPVRRRLHPMMLLPAFVAGIFVACLAGLFKDLPELLRSPRLPFWPSSHAEQEHRHNTADDSLTSNDPPYLIHPTNGHVYLSSSFASRTWSTLDQPTSDHALHPLHALIQNATLSWKEKLERQSKTLEEAVTEYRRRYHRAPPKGFDKWWKWAKEHGVVLVDEYDRICETMEPFWAIPPEVIEKRREDYLEHDVFNTFIIRDGKVVNVGGRKDTPRAHDQLQLMKPFLKYLPNVNITMSHHDGPSNFIDWGTRKKHIDYAEERKVLGADSVDKIDDNAAFWGFSLACPPDSRIRKADLGLEVGVLPSGPAFVGLDHGKAMDVCANPEWRYLHGFTSWAGPRPGVLKPIFSFATTSISADLLVAPLEQFSDTDQNTHLPSWSEKIHNKLLWKGRTTGVWFDTMTRWRSSQRVRLHHIGTAESGSRRVRFLRGDQESNRIQMIEELVGFKELNDRYMNASFVGELWQCTEEDGSCSAVAKELKFEPYIDWQEQNMYKYVFDIDGNAWSGRFRRLLASHSVVFKSTIWPEWYRDHIQPWYHYIPVRIDYSDVYDLMAFFTGDMEGNFGHDRLAQEISDHAYEWVQKHWRYDDLQAYAWRTYLEWARVTSPNRAAMDYQG